MPHQASDGDNEGLEYASAQSSPSTYLLKASPNFWGVVLACLSFLCPCATWDAWKNASKLKGYKHVGQDMKPTQEYNGMHKAPQSLKHCKPSMVGAEHNCSQNGERVQAAKPCLRPTLLRRPLPLTKVRRRLPWNTLTNLKLDMLTCVCVCVDTSSRKNKTSREGPVLCLAASVHVVY